MKAARGFTLIELLVVVVIVAVLATYATARMLNLGKEARVKALQTAQASFDTANKIFYSKAVLQGQELIDASGFNIDTDNNGRPDTAARYGLFKFVTDAEEFAGLEEDFDVRTWYGMQQQNQTYPYFLITFLGKDPSIHYLCYVEIFYPDAPGGEVTYNLVDDDC